MIKVYDLDLPKDIKRDKIISFIFRSNKVEAINITKDDLFYQPISKDSYVEFDLRANHQDVRYLCSSKEVYSDPITFKIISLKYDNKLVEGTFQFFSRIDGFPIIEFDIDQMEKRRNEKINIILEY